VREQRDTATVNGDPDAIGDRGAGVPVALLVVRAKAGDGDAFAQLYRRYLDDVYAFVAARLSNRQAAEDATQTIFFRAMQSLPTCRDDAAFPGWLYAIARNVVTDTYRSHRSRSEPWDDALDPEDPGASPEEVAVQRDDARTLAVARERCLSAPERELFDLLLTDMNDKQIAQALGRTHGAVRTAHWRLLAKLRECLEKLGVFGGERRANV
jgi:RNA polymerase sigma-70 factor (ECF subfamily)